MSAADGDLRVAEVFGPTLQGEGPTAGRPCAFLRLGGCNLACPWCDTPYTWDAKGVTGQAYDLDAELSWWTVDHLVEAVRKIGARRLVVTGGEPLLQQRNLVPLLDALGAHTLEEPPGGWITFEVETNGTVEPTDDTFNRVHRFNVSPKLGANTGMALHRRVRPDALRKLAAHPGAAFKFVVDDEPAIEEALGLAAQVGLSLDRVWLMPLGKERSEVQAVLPWLCERAAALGVNVSNRLHVQAWGNRRGV